MLRDGSFEGSGEWSNGVGDHAERVARVHRTLKRIVRARGALDAEEAKALREAQRLQIWRTYGHASLIEYMELEMGYAPRAALDRLRVANALEELPQIAEALTTGELSFSAAREITRVATPETEQVWLDATEDRNLRQVEQLVSGHKLGELPSDPPDPKLVTTFIGYHVQPEVDAALRQARKILEQEMGERLDDSGFLHALSRLAIDGGGSERTRAPHQVAVTVCSECKRGWQHGGGITVEMSPPAIERALCDAQHIGSVDGQTARATQTIPPTIRRKVHHRDHGRCRVPDCRSSRNLDVHHLIPRENGGTHDLENLIVLCEGHHLAHHEGSLAISGTANKLAFERSPNHRFKIETRAVDTAKALHGLGWKSDVIKAAMNATRAHVGSSDLTLQQWIKIALSNCPKPGG